LGGEIKAEVEYLGFMRKDYLNHHSYTTINKPGVVTPDNCLGR